MPSQVVVLKPRQREGATFDVELQRYVMSGERMTKQDKS